jgi:hypothetical protein
MDKISSPRLKLSRSSKWKVWGRMKKSISLWLKPGRKLDRLSTTSHNRCRLMTCNWYHRCSTSTATSYKSFATSWLSGVCTSRLCKRLMLILWTKVFLRTQSLGSQAEGKVIKTMFKVWLKGSWSLQKALNSLLTAVKRMMDRQIARIERRGCCHKFIRKFQTGKIPRILGRMERISKLRIKFKRAQVVKLLFQL